MGLGGWSGHAKSHPTKGIDPPTVQPVASRYTDSDIAGPLATKSVAKHTLYVKENTNFPSRFANMFTFMYRDQSFDLKALQSSVCSSPLCFSNALGSFVGCSQYTANLFIYVYILLYVTWTTCFDLSIF